MPLSQTEYLMSAEITMPQLSDTMSEGTLIKWLKKEGDKIKSGEKIAEVETDKAVMEMESFESGVLAAILVPEGQKVSVGSILAVVATGSENPAEVKQKAGGAAQAKKVAPAAAPTRERVAETRKPALATAGVGASDAGMAIAATGEIHEAAEVGHGATREHATSVPPVSHKQGNGDGRIRVSPLARRIADDKKIDLHAVNGSGPGGRIVKEDVLAYQPSAQARAEGPAAPALPALIGSGQKQVIPMTKMRMAIAKSLQASKQNIPHFYETVDVDVEDLSALRARINEILEPEKVRLSLGDYISKAVAVALLRHPGVNATLVNDQITRNGDVHLGMAVSVPDGLIVPVLRNIHLMGLKEIRARTVDLVDRARAQRLRQDEMSGGTFTISNLGTYGIREFSAIINPPQVAILAVAAAEKRAVVRGGQIVARTMMTLTLSADHRVVDGAAAAEFLRTLKNLLEQPGMMLI
jgi:pyruvate dehydrogenase E2 component (dihydrolipoamide acetyltransferase)